MNGNVSLKYKLSYPMSFRLTPKDRKAIEYMLSKIGTSGSISYIPKGRTGYAMYKDSKGFVATIRRNEEVAAVFVREPYINPAIEDYLTGKEAA